MSFFSKVAIVFASMTLVTASAFAGDLGVDVEPYAGYGFAGNQSGTMNFTVSGQTFAGTLKGNPSGLTLGARAVVKYMDLVFLGPDFSWYPALSGTDTSLSSVSNIKFGGVIGVQLPMGFRVWGGYNFIDTLNATETNSGAALKGSMTGKSFKVGAGFSPMPMLSVNAEYLFGTLSSANLSGTISGQAVTVTGTADPAVTNNMFLLTVSAPIALPI